MSLAGQTSGPGLIAMTLDLVSAAEALLADAVARVRSQVAPDGETLPDKLDSEQRATHGLAWLATYVEAVRQIGAYAAWLEAAGQFGELEELIVRIGLGEYISQIFSGIAMSPGEIVRPADLGLSPAVVSTRMTPAVAAMMASGNIARHRARLVE